MTAYGFHCSHEQVPPSVQAPAPANVTPQRVAEVVHVSAELGRHTAQLAEYAAPGFDEIALHHVGQEFDGFLDAFGAKVLPQLRE